MKTKTAKKKQIVSKSNGKPFIKIACEGSRWVTLKELIPMQGELKTLSEEDFNKGTKSMLKYGFSFPFFVWIKNGETRCLDGHQRDRILKKHAEDGKKLPAKFPAVGIDAKDEKEAKEKILLLSSQYGKYDTESLYGFIEQADLDFVTLESMIDLPQINLHSFGISYYDQKDDNKNSANMIESKYMIVVNCESEEHQTNTLEKLSSQGYVCRALIS